MKTHFPVRLCGLFLFLAFYLLPSWFSPAQAPKVSDEDAEFVEARSLFWSGHYNESEIKFKTYLIAHPGHKASEDFLKMIVQARKYNPDQITITRKHLESIRIDHLELKDVPWRDVCSRFQKLANPEKDGKAPKNYVNFINLLPSRYATKISLDLRDVTLMDAINHASQQAGLHFVVDTWAVIFELPESKK